MRSFKLAITLALFVSAVPAYAGQTPTEGATICTGKMGREYWGDVIAGTEIYPGVMTGMTRDQSKQVAPMLVGRKSEVELFRGKRMLGEIVFESYHRHGGVHQFQRTSRRCTD
jgi:hypothetical protein